MAKKSTPSASSKKSAKKGAKKSARVAGVTRRNPYAPFADQIVKKIIGPILYALIVPDPSISVKQLTKSLNDQVGATISTDMVRTWLTMLGLVVNTRPTITLPGSSVPAGYPMKRPVQPYPQPGPGERPLARPGPAQPSLFGGGEGDDDNPPMVEASDLAPGQTLVGGDLPVVREEDAAPLVVSTARGPVAVDPLSRPVGAALLGQWAAAGAISVNPEDAQGPQGRTDFDH